MATATRTSTIANLQTAFFMEGSFVDLLREREDPRLYAFAAPQRRAVEQGLPGYEMSFASYGGLHAGEQVGENVRRVAELGEGSPVNPRYHSDPVNEPSIAMGYAELEFILAEAAARGWIDVDAAEHYARGINASMELYGIPQNRVAEYLAHPVVAYDASRGIELISTQKYIAFFLNSGWEAFFNQRRTGHPGFRRKPARPCVYRGDPTRAGQVLLNRQRRLHASSIAGDGAVVQPLFSGHAQG